MALSKTLFVLCVLFALVLLVSSEATSNAHTDEKANELEDAKYGGYGGGGPGYGGGGPGYGGRGPGYGGGGPGYGGGGHGHGGGGYGHGGGNRGGGYRGRGCPYGCCRRYRYGNGCDRCCRDANEVPDAFFADDVKN